MTLSIKVIDSTEGLLAFENEWKAFEKKVNHKNITCSYGWLKAWWNVFGEREDYSFGFNKKLLILCLYRDEKLLAIAPFVKLDRFRKGFKVTSIEFLAQQWAATYIDFIASDLKPEEVEYIFNWLYANERFHIIQLSNIPEHTACFDLNDKALFAFNGCPQVDLDKFKDFEDFKEQVYSKNLKQNIRKAENRIKKDGITCKEEVEASDKKSIERIIKVSLTKLQEEGKHSIYSDPDAKEFVNAVSEELESKVYFILFNDKDVSYRSYFIFNNNICCFDAAYNREFRNHQLGKFSMEQSLKESFKSKYANHCEGTGIDDYKINFLKDITKIYTCIKKGNMPLSTLIFGMVARTLKKKERSFLAECNKITNEKINKI